jgi:hypothetical protein
VLAKQLASPRWAHLASKWDDAGREKLVQLWHQIEAPSRKHILLEL